MICPGHGCYGEAPKFRRDDDHFLIDIVKPDLRRDIPGNGIGDRPAEGVVGDITNAGVRIYVPTDFKKAKPFVTGFMNRLVCTLRERCVSALTSPEELDEQNLCLRTNPLGRTPLWQPHIAPSTNATRRLWPAVTAGSTTNGG